MSNSILKENRSNLICIGIGLLIMVITTVIELVYHSVFGLLGDVAGAALIIWAVARFCKSILSLTNKVNDIEVALHDSEEALHTSEEARHTAEEAWMLEESHAMHERDKLRQLAAIGMQRIFEYDVVNDVFVTSKSRDDGVFGDDKAIENLSVAAKSQMIVAENDWKAFNDFIDECRQGKEEVKTDVRIANDNNEYIWYRFHGRSVLGADGKPDKVIGVFDNIDETKKLELLQADAYMRDSLTGLLKGSYVRGVIRDYIMARNSVDIEEYNAIIIISIDRFKALTDEMGKAFGEEILRNVAADLKGLFYERDIVGRIGEDEFIVLMKHVHDPKEIEVKVRKIQKVFEDTYIGENKNAGSTVGMGISIYPQDGMEFDSLYSKANISLCYAKNLGDSSFDIYSWDKEEAYKEYAELDIMLREAREDYNGHSEGVDDNSLIELAFKLIDESKDTDSAINLLIRQVARRMDLDGIRIKSREDKNLKLITNYSYCSSDDMDFPDDEITYSIGQWAEMLEGYLSNKGLIVYNTLDDANDDINRKLLLATGAKSVLSCAFFDKGEFSGNVEVVDFEHERSWTREDITTIRAVANVVSSYLLKMKAFEAASNEVERLTFYDSLTGLLKYEKFYQLTNEYLKEAPRGSYSMIYLDLANFKYINEGFGYEEGDKVLCELAELCMSHKDLYIYGSRVFSDNILIFAKADSMTDEMIQELLYKIIASFVERLESRFGKSKVGVVIGVCRFEVNGSPVPIKSIIGNANRARKEAKLPDKPNVIIYDDHMGEKVKKEIAFANDMDRALQDREFVVYLQPKVNLEKNKIDGAEALVRWQKADGSMIYPNDFIPVFEKNKSITVLDYFVYEEICRYLRKRMDDGKELIRVSVNVSRIHLYSADRFMDKVESLIKTYEIPPEYLEFELTETVFTDRVDETVDFMTRLHELGVKVSMDDFGAGYSSLNVLTKLPLDVLKLDKEFLRDFEVGSDEKLIIPNIIDMAKKLKLQVVCEGVETSDQVNFLRRVGCDYAQGYYYSKPVPQSEFNQLVDIG